MPILGFPLTPSTKSGDEITNEEAPEATSESGETS